MLSLEVQLNRALDEIEQLKRVIASFKVGFAKYERDGVLKTSGLPATSIKRISAAFRKSTDNAGLKEAINCERKLL